MDNNRLENVTYCEIDSINNELLFELLCDSLHGALQLGNQASTVDA